MHVMNHNWSARKQRLHLQSGAWISHYSALSESNGSGFDSVGHHLSLTAKTQISVCKSPFLCAGTALSLFCALKQ